MKTYFGAGVFLKEKGDYLFTINIQYRLGIQDDAVQIHIKVKDKWNPLLPQRGFHCSEFLLQYLSFNSPIIIAAMMVVCCRSSIIMK